MRLKGKTALIAGAARNIGKATALTFAREGAHKHAGNRGAASRSGGPVERRAGTPVAGMRPWNRP